MGSVLGDTIDSPDIIEALRTTVQLWQRTYLDDVARANGLTTSDNPSPLPSIRSFPASLNPETFPEDQFPSLITVVPGTAGVPRKTGSGWITNWTMGVGVVVQSTSREKSRALVGYYAKAIRKLILQHPSLGVDFVTGVDWLSTRSDNLPIRNPDTRSIGATFMAFDVQTQELTTRFMGPTVPIDDGTDPGDWPTVESADIRDITGEVISE